MKAIPGLRANFAAGPGVMIQQGPNGEPREIIALEGNYVITKNVKTGHKSRIKLANLTRYRVAAAK
jgi:hypothetical protein